MDSNNLQVGSRFIASTMHEVRTPLQTIIGTLELLEETPLNKEQLEYIHQIDFSANALLGLANDVLDFTKITSNNFKLEITPYDAITLTERVVDLITVEAFNRGLEVITDIDYSIPSSVMGDPTRVQQIILNLVKNAAKFTMQGFILVRVTVKNSMLVFEVIDSGIGVPDDKKDMIFSDYYQVDSSATRKIGGTGLGLSISKNLVNVMKGRIGILSNPSGGSNFWFTLPLEIPEFASENTPKVKIPSSGKILVVEDNILAMKALVKKLKYFGVQKIQAAKSGEEALALAIEAQKKGEPFTAAFVDMIMSGGMDGWKFVSEIAKHILNADLKIYLMVPEGQLKQDAKLKLLNLCSGYIYKPIKHEALTDILLEIFPGENNVASANQKTKLPEFFGTESSPTDRKVTSILDEQIASGVKILIAEDQPVNQKLLATFLKRFGAHVYLAENGEVAVNQIKEHPDVDIIFMDIFMPVKSGIDATMELRQNGYKGVIIACTANNDPDDFKAYKEIGVSDIVVKPFKRNTIKDLLEKWTSFLMVPNAKDIISLTFIKSQVSDLWDIEDFMDTTDNNTEFAVSLMDEYILQTDQLMANLVEELQKSDSEKDYNKIELYTHTMKGSSASVSAKRFAELGRKMNDAAKEKNMVDLESARINFAIDFITFKNLISNWKHSV